LEQFAEGIGQLSETFSKGFPHYHRKEQPCCNTSEEMEIKKIIYRIFLFKRKAKVSKNFDNFLIHKDHICAKKCFQFSCVKGKSFLKSFQEIKILKKGV
jgi:hypothetical protein